MHTHHDIFCKLCGEVTARRLQPRGNEAVSNLPQDESIFAQIMRTNGSPNAAQFCNRYNSITILTPVISARNVMIGVKWIPYNFNCLSVHIDNYTIIVPTKCTSFY
jgi:hypothetical protein